jgi:hypothetical protein
MSPQTQQIIMAALSDGTNSAAPSVSFSYVCDTIATDSSKHSPISSKHSPMTASGIELSVE